MNGMHTESDVSPMFHDMRLFLGIKAEKEWFQIVWKPSPPAVVEKFGNTTLGVKVTIDGVQYGTWKYYRYAWQDWNEVYEVAKKMLDSMEFEAKTRIS